MTVRSQGREVFRRWGACLGLWTWVLGFSGVAGHAYDAFSDSDFDPRLSAAAYGAGALAGAQRGAEAVLGNPALLATLRGMELSLTGGLLPQPNWSTTDVFALPLPKAGKIGLGISVLGLAPPEDGATFPMQEEMLLLAYGYSLLPELHVGARWRAIRLSEPGAPALSGQGLDAGFAYVSGPWWAGAVGVNLVQPWIDTGREGIAYPRRLLVNTGANWEGVLKASVEASHSFSGTQDTRYALGVEGDFSEFLIPRIGADAYAGYAGFGLQLDRWSLQYAGRYAFQDQKLIHWLGVSGRFGAYEVRLSASGRYLTKGGVTRSLQFAVKVPREAIYRQWTFEIRDAFGQQVFMQKGEMVLPKELVWEGRTATNEMVKDGEYFASLQGVDFEGNRLESNRVSIRVVSRRTEEFIQVK